MVYTPLTLAIGGGAYLVMGRAVLRNEVRTDFTLTLDIGDSRCATGYASSMGDGYVTLQLVTVVAAAGTLTLTVMASEPGAVLFAGAGTQLQAIQLH